MPRPLFSGVFHRNCRSCVGPLVTQDETSVRVGEMRARYLAAADGLHSPLRRSLGVHPLRRRLCPERAQQGVARRGGVARQVVPDLAELPKINAGGGIVAAEAFAIHRDRIASDGERYDQRVMKRIAAGGRLGADQLIATGEVRRDTAQLLADGGALRTYEDLSGASGK